MAVKKMYGYEGCKETSPIRRSPKAPHFNFPEHNPEPSSARGKRRSNKTEEYQENCVKRSKQSSPVGQRGGSVFRGPMKGPSKRPQGCGRERWVAFMEGRSSTL